MPTAKLGLELIEDADTFAAVEAKLDGNAQKIDDFFGVVECTSGTRPSTPAAGMLIRETDTGYFRVRNQANNAWITVNQALGVAANADITGPVSNQAVWNRTDRAFYFWDGSSWRKLVPMSIAPPSQLASGTLAAGGTVTLFQQTVNYPGFPYVLKVSASCGWGMVNATQPGRVLELNLNIDSTTYNTNRFVAGYEVSHSLGALFSQPTVSAGPEITNFGDFTTTTIVRAILRNTSGDAITIPASATDATMCVEVVPRI